MLQRMTAHEGRGMLLAAAVLTKGTNPTVLFTRYLSENRLVRYTTFVVTACTHTSYCVQKKRSL